MRDAPSTRPSLLFRIRDERDASAWGEFVDLYAPLVHGYGMRCGLQDADAADVAQDVLVAVAQAMPGFNYDRQSGAFRAWLLTVTRNTLRNFIKLRRRHPRGSGKSAVHDLLDQQIDPVADDNTWDREYEHRLFDWAVEKIRRKFQPTTWSAFWETAVENRDVPVVAAELGLTAGQVYLAKSRVLARIRQEIERVGDR